MTKLGVLLFGNPKLAVLILLTGFLFMDEYLVCAGIFFFYFYIVRAVDNFCCTKSLFYPFITLFIL